MTRIGDGAATAPSGAVLTPGHASGNIADPAQRSVQELFRADEFQPRHPRIAAGGCIPSLPFPLPWPRQEEEPPESCLHDPRRKLPPMWPRQEEEPPESCLHDPERKLPPMWLLVRDASADAALRELEQFVRAALQLLPRPIAA